MKGMKSMKMNDLHVLTSIDLVHQNEPCVNPSFQPLFRAISFMFFVLFMVKSFNQHTIWTSSPASGSPADLS